ncbi:hypothetical protein Scep_009823 [Stephania cephalantha]|uniref:Uncharacterized protein n=1 Tax=Stephania cephalantha TaxID=152367 RepID=A0AAP0JTY4_9MAGN
MDGAGPSQPQPPPPPPPPHDQQQAPQIDPADPPQQGDNVEQETQEWLTRDEQLGDTYVTWLETDIFTAGLGFLMLSIEELNLGLLCNNLEKQSLFLLDALIKFEILRLHLEQKEVLVVPLSLIGKGKCGLESLGASHQVLRIFLPLERHSQGVVGGGAGDGVGPMVVFSDGSETESNNSVSDPSLDSVSDPSLISNRTETEIMHSVSDPFLIRDGSETECKNSGSDPFLISNGSETELMHSVSDPFLIRDGSETECKNSVSDPFLIRDRTETECIISVFVPSLIRNGSETECNYNCTI